VDDDQRLSFVYYALWLVLLLPPLFVVARRRGLTVLRDAALWIGVIAVIALGYAYRGELAQVWVRVKGELLPHQGIAAGAQSVSFRAAADGHFHVEAEIEGQSVRFMVDTGASDVVLNASDARRLGFEPSRLAFTRLYRTANGEILGAPVTLRSVRVGPIELKDVRASVSEADMGRSLLGMSFLGRLGGYAVENGTLTLRR